jgi:hypothetical protein
MEAVRVYEGFNSKMKKSLVNKHQLHNGDSPDFNPPPNKKYSFDDKLIYLLHKNKLSLDDTYYQKYK